MRSGNWRRLDNEKSELEQHGHTVVTLSDREWLIITNTPKEGAMKGIELLIKLYFPKEYPWRPPELIILTPLHHPNVTYNGKLCKCSDDRWAPTMKSATLVRRTTELMS